MDVLELQQKVAAHEANVRRIADELKAVADKIEAKGGTEKEKRGLSERSTNLFRALDRAEAQRDDAKAAWEAAIREGLDDGSIHREAGTPFDDHIARAERPQAAGLKGRLTLTKDQSVSAWLKANKHVADEPPLSFDKYMRGLVTGDWRGAEVERKAMNEGTLTAGGHLVPTPLAGSIIDLARNQMVVAQAGATWVPMTASTLKVPRLTGEGTPGWRSENAAIADADLAFDAVTFTARSLNRMVKLSVELFEDADPSAEGIIAASFAQQIALELDRVALRGTGTAPEPRGILNTSGITTTTHGANGSAITNYDWLLDAVGAVRDNNYAPGAQIHAPRSETSLSKLKEATTNAYLAPPAGLADIPRLTTRQVPVNLTVGTSTDCSEIYTGQWNQLGIGIRTGFRLEFLRERYADNGQVAFLAWLRADVQLFQPSAFVVDTGVRG